MCLMGDKMFKYTLKFSLRFTECCYEIICLTNLMPSFLYKKTSFGGYDVDVHLNQ